MTNTTYTNHTTKIAQAELNIANLYTKLTSVENEENELHNLRRENELHTIFRGETRLREIPSEIESINWDIEDNRSFIRALSQDLRLLKLSRSAKDCIKNEREISDLEIALTEY
jgi:hypothetical protein